MAHSSRPLNIMSFREESGFYEGIINLSTQGLKANKEQENPTSLFSPFKPTVLKCALQRKNTNHSLGPKCTLCL